jgi:hypothetical protein
MRLALNCRKPFAADTSPTSTPHSRAAALASTTRAEAAARRTMSW